MQSVDCIGALFARIGEGRAASVERRWDCLLASCGGPLRLRPHSLEFEVCQEVILPWFYQDSTRTPGFTGLRAPKGLLGKSWEATESCMHVRLPRKSLGGPRKSSRATRALTAMMDQNRSQIKPNRSKIDAKSIKIESRSIKIESKINQNRIKIKS